MAKSYPILSRFFLKGKKLRYKAGSTIIRPTNNPRKVYYIEQGYIFLHTQTGGEHKLHAIYKKGEIFPLLWAIDKIKKDFFFEALGDVILFTQPIKAFNHLIKSNPRASLEVMKMLTNLLNIFMDRVDNLSIVKSYPKLIARLLFFADRFGKKNGQEIIINLPLTQTEIASSIAITRETVSRELANLEDKRLIVYKNQSITIKDKEGLIAELSNL